MGGWTRMNGWYGQVLGCGGASDLPAPAPNPAVEPTPNSLRSCVAPAIGRGSPPALGRSEAEHNSSIEARSCVDSPSLRPVELSQHFRERRFKSCRSVLTHQEGWPIP